MGGGWRGWCFVFLSGRMRRLMGSGCRMLRSLPLHTIIDGTTLTQKLSRKIFPPTPSDLPSTASKSASPEPTSDKQKPAVSSPSTSPAELQAKKLKTAAEDIDKDWEAVDKPGVSVSEKTTDTSEEGEKVETASEKTTDISDEGEKVDVPDLGADDGEKIEKPKDKDVVDELAESGEVLPKHGLLKDW